MAIMSLVISSTSVAAETFSADDMLTLGLVDRILPAAQLRAEAALYAESLLGLAPMAVTSMLTIIRQLEEGALDRKTAAGLANACSDSQDVQEGILAQREKRAANFNKGYFFEPTVMADVPEEAAIMSREPFGPLAPISKFTEFEDVVTRANGLPFGLASYCYTSDQKRANELANSLETGMVGVNNFMVSMAETPFGGVKESGYGQEGGIEGLEAYLNHKYVSQTGM